MHGAGSLKNEELRNLQGDQIKEYEMGGRCSTHWIRNAYEILVGIHHERKKPLGRTRCRWEDNIRRDLREIGWEGVDWIHLAQDREQWRALVNTVINLRVP